MFENELVPFEGMEFHRIKVIDSKGKGKNKKYLVHYLGWPEKFNEWVPEERLKDIQPERDSDNIETEQQNVSENDQNSEDDDHREGENQNDLEIEENDQIENNDDIQNDNDVANSFYEPYPVNLDNDVIEDNDNNFYEPFIEDDPPKANDAGIRTRKRKSDQPERLKVNFVADDKKNEIKNIDDKKNEIQNIEPNPPKRRRKYRKKQKKGGKK